MKVEFTRMWFSPAGRFRPGVQNVPDEYAKLLPSTAKVIKEPKVAKKASTKKAED